MSEDRCPNLGYGRAARLQLAPPFIPPGGRRATCSRPQTTVTMIGDGVESDARCCLWSRNIVRFAPVAALLTLPYGTISAPDSTGWIGP